MFEHGDVKDMINLHACSKPITYGIALEEHSGEVVHNFVGHEPSWEFDNELCLNSENLPHNPCTNSGAIMTSSMIKNELQPYER